MMSAPPKKEVMKNKKENKSSLFNSTSKTTVTVTKPSDYSVIVAC